MKAIIFYTCILFISLQTVAQDKDHVPKLILDKFRDTIFRTFHGLDKPISFADDQAGFSLFINKSQKITVVQVKNEKEEFLVRAPKDSNTTQIEYPIKKDMDKDSIIHIRVSQDGKNFKQLRILVTGTGDGAEDDDGNIAFNGESDCPPVKFLNAAGSCTIKDKASKFGEDISTYSDNTVVYIYDFNPDPAKRMIWKLRNRSGALDISPADFGTERLRPRQQVYFKVVNINKFLFDVFVTDTTVQLGSEPSALFTRLFLGDASLLGKLMDVFTENVTGAHSTGKTKSALGKVAADLRCFFVKYNGLQAAMLKAYNSCSNFPCCTGLSGAEYQSIANDLLNVKIGMAVVFQNMITENINVLKTKSEKLKSCEAINTQLEANQKERKPIEEKPVASRTPEEVNALKALIAKKDELEKKQCKEDLDKLKSEIAALENELKYYSAINDLQNKNLPSEQDLRKLIVFLNNIVEQNNTHVIGPVMVKGNRLDLSATIRSKDSITKYFSLPAYSNDPIDLQIPVIWKTSATFSAGSFLGIPERLKNKTYEWQQIPNPNNTVLDTAKFILVESGYTPPPFGFAALGNLELKLWPAFGVGISAGVGITIENQPRPAYLFGGSLFFGDLRQFVITGGVAGMQVKTLNNNLEQISAQRIIYANKQPITYYNEFKVGAFVSVTYTPFTILKRR